MTTKQIVDLVADQAKHKWEAYCIAAELAYCQRHLTKKVRYHADGRVLYDPGTWLDDIDANPWPTFLSAVNQGLSDGQFKAQLS